MCGHALDWQTWRCVRMTVWINVVVRAKLYAHLFEAIQNVYEMQGDYSEISICARACYVSTRERKRKKKKKEMTKKLDEGN